MKNIELTQGDITRIKIDAIVNAANSSLMGGGGVDGAIHRAAGPELLNECRKIVARQGGCKTGEAVITPAGNLPCRYVIHTVGPVYKDGNSGEAVKLRNCYTNSLRLAKENNITSIAFPNISTGIYGYPKELACKIALEAISDFEDLQFFDKIVIVCFDDENFHLYQNNLK